VSQRFEASTKLRVCKELKLVAAGLFFPTIGPAIGFEQADAFVQPKRAFHVVESAVHFGPQSFYFLVEVFDLLGQGTHLGRNEILQKFAHVVDSAHAGIIFRRECVRTRMSRGVYFAVTRQCAGGGQIG